MDRNVFTDSLVSEIFNEEFINLKVDMESEMSESFKKYEIQGYPTFLFIDYERNLKYKKAGFLNMLELKNLGQEILKSREGEK